MVAVPFVFLIVVFNVEPNAEFFNCAAVGSVAYTTPFSPNLSFFSNFFVRVIVSWSFTPSLTVIPLSFNCAAVYSVPSPSVHLSTFPPVTVAVKVIVPFALPFNAVSTGPVNESTSVEYLAFPSCLRPTLPSSTVPAFTVAPLAIVASTLATCTVCLSAVTPSASPWSR